MQEDGDYRSSGQITSLSGLDHWSTWASGHLWYCGFITSLQSLLYAALRNRHHIQLHVPL